ncbi:MAG: carboxypeptidase-like regulatory domain-containing protein [Blastocatellia bacterium]
MAGRNAAGSLMVRALAVSSLVIWVGSSIQPLAQARPDSVNRAVTVLKSAKTTYVPPSEGYLDIFTAPNALVTLTGRESKQLRADQNGRATFEKLKLGVYSFKVDLADYQSEELKEFKVLPGRPTSFRVDLKPVFSTLVLGMGSQAASDVLVRIDDQPIAADQVEPRDGKLFVRRLRVADNETHLIRIEKPYHEPIVIERPIRLGECENFVSVELKQLTGRLILAGNAGARIYLNGEDRGVLTNSGEMSIPDLVPGDYQLRAQLFGYQDLNLNVTLPPGRDEERVELRLTQLIERAEIDHSFLEDLEQFFPGRPEKWTITAGKYLTVDGPGEALLRSGLVKDQQFSIFEDSMMRIRVREWNGRGIGWIVRATDLKTYYRFQLIPSATNSLIHQLVFSTCRDGRCETVKTDDLATVTVGMLRKGAFTVDVNSSGERIWHCITTSDGKKKPLGPTYAALTFARGGSGLSGVEGSVTVIDDLLLQPGNSESELCRPEGR